MRRFPPRALGLLLLGLGGACHSPADAPSAPRPSRSSTRIEPGAVWLSHPDVTFRESFRARAPGRRTLVVGDEGTRILLDEAGRAVGPVMGSPEPLVGALFREGRFTFLAASGRGYSAETAEGPLVLDRDVREPFVSAAWGGSDSAPLFVGVGSDGRAHASEDEGRSWRVLESDRFFVSARRARANELVLQSLPESAFRFQPRVGLARVTEEESFAPLSIESLERAPLLGAPRLPRLGQLGRWGVLDSVSGHVLVIERGRSPQSLSAFRGALGRALTEVDAKLPDSCVPEGLGTSARLGVVVCREAALPQASARDVLVHGASEKSWRRVGKIQRRGDMPLSLKVSPSGLIAASGICSPNDPEPDCDGRGIYFLAVQPAQAKVPTSKFARAPIPEMGQPLAFAFAGDGALFAVYQRVFDDHLVMYRIADRSRGGVGGEFALGQLDLTRVFRLSGGPENSAEMLPGSGDTMGLVLTLGGRRLVLSVDADLQVGGFGAPPESSSAIGGSGPHVFAVDVRRKMAWESRNAGLSFEAVRVPARLAEDKAPDEQLLACGAAGCLVGSGWTRLGWNGLGRNGLGSSGGKPHSQRAEAPPSASLHEPKKRVYTTCEATGEASGRLSRAPTAHDAARGNVAWSEVLVDRARAAVSAVHAPYGSSVTETRELLPPSFEPERAALFVSEQVEGSAALRYRLPLVDGSQLEQLEVAWDNRVEDTLRREVLSLPEASPEERERTFEVRLGDYDRAPRGAQIAKPWLLSVSSGRVYVGFHGRADPADGLFVLGDTAGGRQVDLGKSFLAKPPRGAQLEVFRVGEKDVPVWLSESGLTATWVDASGSLVDYRFGASDLPGVDAVPGVAYRGAVPEFSVRFDDVKSTWSKAYRLSVLDLVQGKRDSIRRVATAFDLGDTPHACSPAERSHGERGIYPQPKDRPWQIELTLPGGSARFDVVREVVFGSVDEPCLGMLEAELVDDSAGSSGRAYARVLVDPSAGAVSWLFRSPSSAEHYVSAVPLRCDQSASAEPQVARAH